MSRCIVTGLAILFLSGLLTAAPTQVPLRKRVPPPGTTATSSGTRVISPVAVVTWVTTYGNDGIHVLDLIVLWRGSPGWFSRGSGSGTSSGGSMASFHSTIRYGGLGLLLEFESKTRVAQIQGKSVPLHDDNVILVDDVDATGGPSVIGTLRVDPALSVADNGYPLIEPVLRRSPEIVTFLRCDARLPDGRGQTVIDSICAQVVGR
jgi:hypothetical protein